MTSAQIASLLVCFLLSAVCLRALRSTAYRLKLIDEPCKRKRHTKATPLLGGISIFIGFLLAVPIGIDAGPMLRSFLLAAGLMVLLGIIDDKYDVSALARLLGQLVIASVLIFFGRIEFESLGNLLGFGDVSLGWFSIPFTYLAILAAINAFNMIDGIDGLLGGIAFTSFSSISLLAGLHGAVNLSYLSLLIAVALIPFLVVNLGLNGANRKVFMGDSGSMFIGLAIVWLLVIATQFEHVDGSIKPVTALWLVALPIMDIVTVMGRRLLAKQSPLKAGRDHIHHCYLNAGFTPKITLIYLLSFSLLMQVLGLLGDLADVADYMLFFGFLAAYIAYLLQLKWLKTRAKSIEVTHT